MFVFTIVGDDHMVPVLILLVADVVAVQIVAPPVMVVFVGGVEARRVLERAIAIGECLRFPDRTTAVQDRSDRTMS